MNSIKSICGPQLKVVCEGYFDKIDLSDVFQRSWPTGSKLKILKWACIDLKNNSPD
jgi:hypothetical protein